MYVDGKKKRSVSNTLVEDIEHKFRNDNQVIIPTEVRIRNLGTVGLLSLLGIVIVLFLKKKRRYS